MSILSVNAFFGSGWPTPRSIEGEMGGTRMRMRMGFVGLCGWDIAWPLSMQWFDRKAAGKQPDVEGRIRQ